MFCKKCGTELPDGSSFCTNCGADLTEAQADFSASSIVGGIQKKVFEPKLIRLLTVAFLIAGAACLLLVNIGNFGNDFMPVIGGLVTLVFQVALFGSIAVLLLLGKTELAKKVLFPVFSYWLISTILQYLGDTDNIIGARPGLIVTYCIFEFLIALALIAAVVLFLLSTIQKKPGLETVAWLIVFGVLAFAVILFILQFIACIVYKAPWTQYFSFLGDCAIMFGMVCAVPAVNAKTAKPAAAPAPAAETEAAPEEKTEE